MYLALFTADPGEAGSQASEISGAGYVRKPVTMGAPANGVSSNTAIVSWTASGGSYGTTAHMGWMDALVAGNMLYFAPLAVAKTIDDGDSLNIPVGQAVVTLE